MAVVVKKFKVRSNGNVYKTGETISDLTPEDEKRLIEEGYCDNAPSSNVSSEDPPKTKSSGSASDKTKDSNGGTGEVEGGPNTSAPLT